MQEFLDKLNELYELEEELIKQLDFLMQKYSQVQEDKELLQQFIMYHSNKKNRVDEYVSRQNT